jgi:hypothetical protein
MHRLSTRVATDSTGAENGVMDRTVWFALSILIVLVLGAAVMLLVKVLEPLNG